MKKINWAWIALLACLTISSTMLAKEATFKGNISDSMCGLKHMMPNLSDKDCTVACVKHGAKYVLADEAQKKVYELDNQTKAAQFPGAAVVVKGELEKDGKTIHVVSIEAAK